MAGLQGNVTGEPDEIILQPFLLSFTVLYYYTFLLDSRVHKNTVTSSEISAVTYFQRPIVYLI